MIEWKITEQEIPEFNRRIALQLPDGRICSGKTTDTGGFHIDYIDNIDLFSIRGKSFKWIYLDDKE